MSRPTLWVDVDDTLFTADADGVNQLDQRLVTAVQRYYAARGGAVVVWSTGGSQYALLAAQTAFPRHVQLGVVSAFAKAPNLVAPGDIVVDDDPEWPGSALAHFLPTGFVSRRDGLHAEGVMDPEDFIQFASEL